MNCRIRSRKGDERVSTIFAFCSNKWFTFHRSGGILVETLEANSLLFAGQNHLSLVKKILTPKESEKQNEQSESVETRIKEKTEETIQEAPGCAESTEQAESAKGARSEASSNQEGAG